MGAGGGRRTTAAVGSDFFLCCAPHATGSGDVDDAATAVAVAANPFCPEAGFECVVVAVVAVAAAAVRRSIPAVETLVDPARFSLLQRPQPACSCVLFLMHLLPAAQERVHWLLRRRRTDGRHVKADTKDCYNCWKTEKCL